ncbi:MAG: peptide-methionine (S)-S-oxide reductase MsrA [Clostridia bacterium]
MGTQLKDIYLAGGCFWGVQEYFSRIDGVVETSVGYANGSSNKTTYYDIAKTGHSETVFVRYDSDKVSLETILTYYFNIIDPTSKDRQGNDRGTQYRTGVYYTDAEDLDIITAFIEKEQRKHTKPIVVEVQPLAHFVVAEGYHQDYLKKNPGGYCHIDLSSAPKLPVEKSHRDPKIKITKDGPYIVTGGVPLTEQVIVPMGEGYVYDAGRILPQAETYALCRCGKSLNAPFCDGAHEKSKFQGKEVASRADYEARATVMVSKNLDLLDDNRCAYARFCHREEGNVWELTESSGNPLFRKEAIIAASECPSGRLVARDKEGNDFEIEYEPSIDALQDPECRASGGLFVKGKIPIESADGTLYELRNRVVLCRCGRSSNMPFCDATHVEIRYSDK